jgi:hypothetical protein
MTELIWDGKYIDGKRQTPVRVALPFQTIETVNESSADRNKTLEMFASGEPTEWRNRLVWGDKKYVLPSLLPELSGKVNLVYIDPPFATSSDFSFTTVIPESGHEFTKAPSILEQKAYRDTWGKGIDSYLPWFYETCVLLRELLADNGTIFVHLDVHMGPYAKVILDEVFGERNFLNQIAWYYYNKMHDSRKKILPKAYDLIFWYAKNRDSNYAFNHLTEKRDAPVKQLVRAKVGGDTVNSSLTFITQPRSCGHGWLHGMKAGRMVHVGAVDAPVTLSDVRSIAREVWKASNGSGEAAKAAADILGWDFAFELNETARQIAAESRVDVAFKKIPREVLEKKGGRTRRH